MEKVNIVIKHGKKAEGALSAACSRASGKSHPPWMWCHEVLQLENAPLAVPAVLLGHEGCLWCEGPALEQDPAVVLVLVLPCEAAGGCCTEQNVS